MNPAWLPVVGYEDIYDVSAAGGVRNRKTGRVLKQGTSDTRYKVVVLWKGKKGTSKAVHRLVLEAFVGPGDGMDACHADGTRDNNRVDNLRWGTRKENMADAIRHGTVKGSPQPGEMNQAAVLSERDVGRIRESRLFGADTKDLATAYGVSRTQIYRVVSGDCWGHI